MVMSPGWPIGLIPPSIVMWRVASIRGIGAGRWMGLRGDWSKPLEGFAFVNDRRDACPNPRTSVFASDYAIVRLRFANRTYVSQILSIDEHHNAIIGQLLIDVCAHYFNLLLLNYTPVGLKIGWLLSMKEAYSGKQVIRAGEKFLTDEIFDDEQSLNEAFDTLSYWRFSHEVALENALNLLQEQSLKKDKNAIFAKRLKRFVSIVKKLRRFPEMKLKNMQDIGGCRAIVSNPKKIVQIVRELRKRPEFKNGSGRIRSKDYIENPKDDGYRGYHLIGQFDNGLGGKRSIELQIRTRLQHDWATTLEIVDLLLWRAFIFLTLSR